MRHLLGVFREHLVCCFHHLAFVLRRGLPSSLFNAMPNNQLVHFRHEWGHCLPISATSIWTLVTQAIGRVLNFFDY